MPDAPVPGGRSSRRHDLDWLRVLAIVLLVFFHSAMPFVAEWGWHLKNAEMSNLLLELNFFMSRWRMALLFLISGVGTAFALGARPAGLFARERAKRLLLPLAFGIVMVVPPQIYMERLAQGETFSSYLAFWPTIFTTGTYPTGNLSWHHLWFVAYLAIYTIALLPLFVWLRGDRVARVGAWLERVAARAGLAVFALPMAAVLVLLLPHFPGPQDIVHDVAMMTYYMLYFIIGYLLARSTPLWERIERERGTSLRWAVVATLIVNYVRWNDIHHGLGLDLAGMAWGTLLSMMAWCWVLTFLGYGKRYLSRNSALLAWANEGIYPIYILHQTVIVVLAFYVLPLREGVFAKFIFLSMVSLGVTIAVYEVLVRPFAIVRTLFGMKPRGAAPVTSGVNPAFAPSGVPAGDAGIATGVAMARPMAGSVE